MTSLTEEREREIDQLAEELRSKYSTDSGINFERLAQNHNVGLMETDRLGGPLAGQRRGHNYVLGKKSYLISSVRQRSLAHEFGHVLLGHTDPDDQRPRLVQDNEANRFAERLTGISQPKHILLCFPEVVVTHLRHPIAVVKWAWGLYEADAEKVIAEFETDI